MGRHRKRRAATSEESSGPAKKTRVDAQKQTPARESQPSTTKKTQWKNRQRVLLLAGRGVSYQGRHLLLDLRRLMPQQKSDTKFDSKTKLIELNEIASMKNANKVMFLESRKKCDLYMWLAASSLGGPSARFLVENVHTLEELKLTGNCLKGSRPLVSFDPSFDSSPQLRVLKEILLQTFSTPLHHPKSQPFVDHVITFTWLDNRIWFRNYQLTDTQAVSSDKGLPDSGLLEIGPRFTLNPIKIFGGSFCGGTLWENPHYVTPNSVRAALKMKKQFKYVEKVNSQLARKSQKFGTSYHTDETDEIFR